MTTRQDTDGRSGAQGERPLDYFGVRTCGCITAWMAVDGASDKEVRDFYLSMATTGREVRRMEFTEELRQRIFDCPHREQGGTGK